MQIDHSTTTLLRSHHCYQHDGVVRLSTAPWSQLVKIGILMLRLNLPTKSQPSNQQHIHDVIGAFYLHFEYRCLFCIVGGERGGTSFCPTTTTFADGWHSPLHHLHRRKQQKRKETTQQTRNLASICQYHAATAVPRISHTIVYTF